MIIQGSNEPIILKFDTDMSDIQNFSAVLLKNPQTFEKTPSLQELKRWNRETVSINGNEVTLSLTEEETLGFEAGKASLQIKWLTDGQVWFAEEATINIKQWYDKQKLTTDD